MSAVKPPNTIEFLEQDYWGKKPDYDSHLMITIYKLRRKNLEEFSAEDLRIVIGQNQSLSILIPKALEMLEKDILASGDFYPGDLLTSTLTITSQFWKNSPQLKLKLKEIFAQQQQKIKHNTELSDKLKTKLFEQYNDFILADVSETDGDKQV